MAHVRTVAGGVQDHQVAARHPVVHVPADLHRRNGVLADLQDQAGHGRTRQVCPVVGEEGGASGIVAVLGPTRMRYARTIPTVRYLATLLGDLVAQI